MAENAEGNYSTFQQAVLTIFACILTLYFVCFYFRNLRIKPKVPLDVQKVLIITGHPDDECMFFTPTIHALKSAGNFVHLLCLSTGNFYGLGTIRSREILKSCAILGIPESHVHIFNDSSLPDSPVADWPISKIQDIILPVIYYLQPHSVITFDDYGVSGHKNHIAISKALRSLAEHNMLPHFIRAFSLESCPLYRKYTSIIDLPLSFMVSDHMAVVSPLGFIRGLRAMLSHRSQMEWFRYLYILFSRYMLINTLQEIHHHGNYLWSSAAMETGKQQSK